MGAGALILCKGRCIKVQLGIHCPIVVNAQFLAFIEAVCFAIENRFNEGIVDDGVEPLKGRAGYFSLRVIGRDPSIELQYQDDCEGHLDIL